MLKVEKVSGKIPGSKRGRPTENRLPDDFALEVGEYASVEFPTAMKANTAQRVIIKQLEDREMSDYKVVRRTVNGRNMLYIYREESAETSTASSEGETATATAETENAAAVSNEPSVTAESGEMVVVETPTATVEVTVNPPAEDNTTPPVNDGTESAGESDPSPATPTGNDADAAPLASKNPRSNRKNAEKAA